MWASTYPEVSSVAVVQFQDVAFDVAVRGRLPGDGDGVILGAALLGDDGGGGGGWATIKDKNQAFASKQQQNGRLVRASKVRIVTVGGISKVNDFYLTPKIFSKILEYILMRLVVQID